MPITPEQKNSVDAVVSINETGKIPSAAAYSTVTVLTDGAGISYGKHQATDQSGSLDAIVMRYIDLGGPQAAAITPYLAQLKADESTKVDPHNLPQWVKDLEALLATAGQDAIMQRAQDEVFDEGYWTPAVQKCAAMGLVSPLAHLVVYDTCIQSGPGRIDSLRMKFAAKSPSTGGDEKAWVQAFNAARRDFLMSNPNPLVQKSVYRVDSIQGLIDAGNWYLATPFSYRHVQVG